MPKLSGAIIAIVAAIAVVIAIVINWTEIQIWVQAEQRAMQTELARTIQLIRSGDQIAIATLCGACFVYGLLHAIGPGHGKVLIGGAAAASRRTAWRMAGIGFAASLMQAVSAIALAFGGLGLASATGSAIIGSANAVLVPLSFAAMGLVGTWIVIRGVRLLLVHASMPSAHALAGDGHVDQCTSHAAYHAGHDHSQHSHSPHIHSSHCAAGCKHMPTGDEVEKLENWHDVVALVLSIGIRPCSGALVILIISWHFGLYIVGALGTFAMAAGTGLIVAMVAIFATVVRERGFYRADGSGISLASLGGLHVLAGSLVVVVCLLSMMASASTSVPMGLVR